MSLHVTPRKAEATTLDACEVGVRAAAGLYTENVEKWGAWIDPRLFEVPKCGIYSRRRPAWIHLEKAPPTTWIPRQRDRSAARVA